MIRRNHRHWALSASLICAAALFAGSNSAIFAYTNTKGTVTYASVAVRAEASASSAVRGGVKKGDELVITDEVTDGDGKKWYAVTVSSGLKGYVRADLVEKGAAVASGGNTGGSGSQTAGQGAAASAASTVKYNNTIVRTGAGRDSDVRCTVNAGQEMTITSTVTGSDGNTWYGVHFARNGFFYDGFLRSDLLNAQGAPANSGAAGGTPAAGTAGQNTDVTGKNATVKATSVRLRSNASTSGEVAGALAAGHAVVIRESAAGEDGNTWYKVATTLNNKAVEGYIRSDLLTVAADANQGGGQSTASGGALDAAGVKGYIKGTDINIRKEAVNGSILCKLSSGHEIVVTEQKTAGDGKIWCKITFLYQNAAVSGWVRSDFLEPAENTGGSGAGDSAGETQTGGTDTGTGQPVTDGGIYGTVKGVAVRVREAAVNGNVICQLNVGHSVKWLEDVSGGDGFTWYKISFVYQGAQKEGYIRSDFVNIVKNTGALNDTDFETSIQDFPESYKAYLRDLHTKYPKWKFQMVNTGLDWEAAVAAESKVGRNLVSATSPSSWKSTDPQAYNWLVNAWYGFDGASWVAASPDIIRFYLDPRNFLDDSGIFQFETLEYESYHNEAGVASVLASSFMAANYTDTDGAERSYAATFLEAGANNGINPYHLAARCLQEQGYYGSTSVTGAVSGYENLFNFFNIGAFTANGNSATLNGLIYASGADENYYRPWNSRYRAIMGGSKYVAESYVKRGQNTLYFQKFNVVNADNGLYTHQYMSNLQAASLEASKMKRAYSDMNTDLVFRIPVYSNMPDSPCVKPDSTANPNNYLAGLGVEGYEMTPVFSPEADNYSLFVENGVTAVNIIASPVAATSAVSGTGTVELAVGTNTFTIACKAQNGSIKTYTISIVRGE